METKESFGEPTEWLKKQGVVKVAHSEKVRVELREDHLLICSRSVVYYYYKDGHKEDSGGTWICARIPKSLEKAFLKEVTRLLR